MVMKKILFICTGNSCRSQIAEGFARSLKWDAYSAGTNPSKLHPIAIYIMKEIEIDISKQTSDSIDLFIEEFFDIIVTLCDNARETCPVFPNHKGELLHKGFKDPYFATGTKEITLNTYRKTRDDIMQWLNIFIKE